MDDHEVIYPLKWVSVEGGVVTEHERPMSVSSIWSEAFGEGCVSWEAYAALAAKCEALEEALRKERAELMREYDAASDDDDTLGWSLAGRIQAIDEALLARMKGAEADVIASLECALDENGMPDAACQEAVKLLRANAARVRSLEEALTKIAFRSGLLSADYISYGGESGHAETERIASAALAREEGKT